MKQNISRVLLFVLIVSVFMVCTVSAAATKPAQVKGSGTFPVTDSAGKIIAYYQYFCDVTQLDSQYHGAGTFGEAVWTIDGTNINLTATAQADYVEIEGNKAIMVGVVTETNNCPPEYCPPIGAYLGTYVIDSNPDGVLGSANANEQVVIDQMTERLINSYPGQKFTKGDIKFTIPTVISTSPRTVYPGDTITIGETNLDISRCCVGYSYIGWWPGRLSGSPSYKIPFTWPDSQSFSASPAQFSGHAGAWYCTNGDNPGIQAFYVADGKTCEVVGRHYWDARYVGTELYYYDQTGYKTMYRGYYGPQKSGDSYQCTPNSRLYAGPTTEPSVIQQLNVYFPVARGTNVCGINKCLNSNSKVIDKVGYCYSVSSGPNTNTVTYTLLQNCNFNPQSVITLPNLIGWKSINFYK